MPWKKGESGNPRGPKRNVLANGKTLREMAREHTDVALKALIEVIKEGESEAARVGAATALLDRGWGKPTQPIAGDSDMPPLAVASAPDQVLAWIAGQQIESDAETTH